MDSLVGICKNAYWIYYKTSIPPLILLGINTIQLVDKYTPIIKPFVKTVYTTFATKSSHVIVHDDWVIVVPNKIN